MWFHSPVRLHRAGEIPREANHTTTSKDYPKTGNAAASDNHPDTRTNDSGSDNNTATQRAHLYHGRRLKS